MSNLYVFPQQWQVAEYILAIQALGLSCHLPSWTFVDAVGVKHFIRPVNTPSHLAGLRGHRFDTIYVDPSCANIWAAVGLDEVHTLRQLRALTDKPVVSEDLL